MTRKRTTAAKEPCPPVAVAPGVLVRTHGVPKLRDTTGDGYEEEAPVPDQLPVAPGDGDDAPPKRKRKRVVPDGEIRVDIIDMKDKPTGTRPMPKCLYFPDDD